MIFFFYQNSIEKKLYFLSAERTGPNTIELKRDQKYFCSEKKNKYFSSEKRTKLKQSASNIIFSCFLGEGTLVKEKPKRRSRTFCNNEIKNLKKTRISRVGKDAYWTG